MAVAISAAKSKKMNAFILRVGKNKDAQFELDLSESLEGKTKKKF